MMTTYTQPARIDPEAIYDDRTVCLAISTTGSALARARKDGSLRYSRRGLKNYYFGRWLIDWLDGGDPTTSGLSAVGSSGMGA